MNLIFLELFTSFSSPRLRRIPTLLIISGRTNSVSTNSVGLIYLFVLLVFFLLFTSFTDRTSIGIGETACIYVAALLYALLLVCILLTIFQTLRTISKFSPGSSVEAVLLRVTHNYIVYTICIGCLKIVIVSINYLLFRFPDYVRDMFRIVRSRLFQSR